MSTAHPTRRGAKTEEIDPETERIILERLATFESEPKMDAREAIEEIRRELRLQHPVSR